MSQSATLCDAAGAGDVAAVATLLDARCNVNEIDDSGSTPLILAAEEGHVAVLQKLIDARANVNATNNRQDTALSVAVYAEDLEAAEVLVSCGLPHSYVVGLCRAAVNDHVDMIALLVGAKADVNCLHPTDLSPLHWASSKGSANAVKWLLEASAEVDCCGYRDHTPLTFACVHSGGGGEVIRALVDGGADINSQDERGCTALSLACRSGYHDAIQVLTAAGADVGLADYDDETPLDKALFDGPFFFASRGV